MNKEYKITEELAFMMEEANALEDTIVYMSKRIRTTRIAFWKSVYLLHPELENSKIKLNYNGGNVLIVTAVEVG